MAAGRAEFSGTQRPADYSRSVTRAPRQMLAMAAFCAGAFGLLLFLAYEVGPARWLDAAALDGFASLGDHDRLYRGGDAVVHAMDPAPFAAMATAIVVVAL